VVRVLFIGAVLVFLSGCATAPVIDAKAVKNIKSVTIAIPPPSVYSAMVGYAPTGDMLSTLIGDMLSDASNSRASGFDTLVKTKLGNPNLNEEFTAALAAALKRRGLKVSEVNFRLLAAPKLRWVGNKAVIEGGVLQNTDAIAVLTVRTYYFAAGALNSFGRVASVWLQLFRADDDSLIGRQRFVVEWPHDPKSGEYSYMTYAGLCKDLPHAFGGLRKALLSLVPKVANAM
jgi:hypothetical protein